MTSSVQIDAPATVEAHRSTREYPHPFSGSAQAGYPASSGYSGQLQSCYQLPVQTLNDVPVTLQMTSQHVIRVKSPYSNQMVANIFVSLCCFFPTGIMAVLRVQAARNALVRGDLSAAEAHKKAAKNMFFNSRVLGSITFIVVIIVLGATLSV